MITICFACEQKRICVRVKIQNADECGPAEFEWVCKTCIKTEGFNT